MFGHLMEIVFAVVIMYYIILKSKKEKRTTRNDIYSPA